MEMDFGLVLLKEEDKLYVVQERSDLNFLERSDFCICVKQAFFILITAGSVPVTT